MNTSQRSTHRHVHAVSTSMDAILADIESHGVGLGGMRDVHSELVAAHDHLQIALSKLTSIRNEGGAK